MLLYAVTNGHMDEVPVARIREFEEGFLRFMDASRPEIGEAITRDRAMSPETIEALKAAIGEFKQTVSF